MIQRLLDLPQDNAIFLAGLRGVKWIRSVEGVYRYGRRVLYGAGAVALVGFGVVIYTLSSNMEPNSVENVQAGLYLSGTLLLSDLLNTGFIPALAAILFSVNLIHSEKTANRLDLVQLAVGESVLVEGRHALAMARAWRFTVIWVAARLAGLALILATGILWLLSQDVVTVAREEFNVGVGVLLGLVPPLLFLAGLYAVYAVLEPIWELKALTALGLNVSTRTESPGGAAVMGVVGWLVLNVVVGLIVGLISLPFIIVNIFLTAASAEVGSILLYIFCGAYLILPAYSAAGFYGLYRLYRAIYQRLLKNAATRLTEAA